ncbi:14-3-3 protein zeta-like [Branchiostoma floridae x Branchiostoma japonicum]
MAGNVDLIGRAKVAQKVELYDYMAECMKERVETTPVLSAEERDLLSEAYKNEVGSRRSAWRILTNVEHRAPDDNREATWLRERVETEIKELCGDVLTLVDKLLGSETLEDEAQVFYYKMNGDYYRYLVEVSYGEDRDNKAKKAKKAYEQAWAAAKPLRATNPVKLELALNVSVFHYEILNQVDSACTMAREAFDAALADESPDCNYGVSQAIMIQLRGNLTLWQSETNAED